MAFNLLFWGLVAVSGFNPSFLPPSTMGAETAAGGVRAFSMGGATAGVPDSSSVSILNPSASAWSTKTGLTWAARMQDSPDESWSGASSFPEVGVLVPLPLGVQFSAILSGRSRLQVTDQFQEDQYTGSIHWTGSTAESYIGATLRSGRSLAFFMGGRCFFGSALGDAVATVVNPGPFAPVTTVYRDDVAFEPSWGLSAGGFLNSGPVSAGFSITTDRSGTMSIYRDYTGPGEADTTYTYTVPGELACGISARIHPRVLIALDYFARKELTLLGDRTGEGSYTSAGFEVLPGLGFRVRGGYRVMNGLWRDGAQRYSGGIGYDIAGGKASFDVGAGWETWGDDMSETVLYMGLRASESWLGR